MTAALVQFLRDRLDERYALVRAIPADRRLYVQPDQGRLVFNDPDEKWADGEDRLPNNHNIWALVFDPQEELRHIAAKRLMLDEALASRHLVTGDQYMDCPLATEADGVDAETTERIQALNDDYRKEFGREPVCAERCGRDARVHRTLELLSLPYVDHPDYMQALLATQA